MEGSAPAHIRLQVHSFAVAGAPTYGCSPRQLRLQPPSATVAGMGGGQRAAVPRDARVGEQGGHVLGWGGNQPLDLIRGWG